MSIFKRNVSDAPEVKVLKAEIKKLEEQIEREQRVNSLVTADSERNHKIEVEDLNRKHSEELAKAKFDAEKATSKALVDATQAKKKLEIENGVLTKEVEILRTAFKNLGFDVKDMKDILGKLVDGIVSKNTIQLVK